LVVADNPSRSRELIRAEVVDIVVNNKNIGGRSAAEVENQLTQLLLQTQQAHEEIILEVIDFTPGTEYGYNHPCPPELQKP
jgi:predicted metal-dependent enzyme (double-stranded beta helix superfamily)